MRSRLDILAQLHDGMYRANVGVSHGAFEESFQAMIGLGDQEGEKLWRKESAASSNAVKSISKLPVNAVKKVHYDGWSNSVIEVSQCAGQRS